MISLFVYFILNNYWGDFINTDKYIGVISSVDLFKDIKMEELNQLLHSLKMQIKEYGKDQLIHIQNEVCNSMDIIIEGQVSVQKIDGSGNILTINVFSERDNLGANLIFSSRNYYPMTVVSMCRTIILNLKRDLILELCRNNINFMIEFMKSISDRTTILADKINEISLKTIRQQILDFLKYESKLQNSDTIKLNITKKDLAERLGIQRTSLSRELNKMRKDGLVEYDAKTIVLKNYD